MRLAILSCNVCWYMPGVVAFPFCMMLFIYVLFSLGPVDRKAAEESDKEAGHQKAISSLSKSLDWSHFLTGSLDKSAKVILLGLLP